MLRSAGQAYQVVTFPWLRQNTQHLCLTGLVPAMTLAGPILTMIHAFALQTGQYVETDDSLTRPLGLDGSALSATTLSILIMQHTKADQTEYILCRQCVAPALAVFYAIDLAFG